MFGRASIFISLTFLVASIALMLPVQAQKPVPPSAEITFIQNYNGTPACTEVETDCIYVIWKINNAPADKSGFSFVVSGRLNYEAGSSTIDGITVENGNALSNLLKFFHSGSGAIKSAEITLKLFNRDGLQKILASQNTKTQRF